MALEMKTNCQICDHSLQPDSEAYIYACMNVHFVHHVQRKGKMFARTAAES